MEKLQGELNDWLTHPTTQIFRKTLRLWKESIKSQWSDGAFNHETLEKTALANHKAASEFGTLDRVLNLDAEEIQGTLENEYND